MGKFLVSQAHYDAMKWTAESEPGPSQEAAKYWLEFMNPIDESAPAAGAPNPAVEG